MSDQARSDSLTPSEDAEAMATELVEAGDVQETVIEETLASAEEGRLRESGRTACGSSANLRDPLNRFPESVELSACPRSAAGIWHTHVTEDQLETPFHSLPDAANVAFGGLDASMIVGVETSDVLLASEDEEAMQRAFKNALGLDIRSAEDVVRAFRAGQIPDPEAARQRVRRELAPLFRTENTSFPELKSRLESSRLPIQASATADDGTVAADAVAADAVAADTHRIGGPPPDAGNLRSRARGCRGLFQPARPADLDIAGLVIGNAIGTIVGNLTNQVLFE